MSTLENLYDPRKEKRRLRISPSVICNLKCPYCNTAPWINKGCNVPIWPVNIIEFCKIYRPTEIILCGTGETVLCPNFLDLWKAVNSVESVTNIRLISNIIARPKQWWDACILSRNPAIDVGIIGSVHLDQGNIGAVKALMHDYATIRKKTVNSENFLHLDKKLQISANILISCGSSVILKTEYQKDPVWFTEPNVSFFWDCFIAETEKSEIMRELGVLSSILNISQLRRADDASLNCEFDADSVAIALTDKKNLLVIKIDADLKQYLLCDIVNRP